MCKESRLDFKWALEREIMGWRLEKFRYYVDKFTHDIGYTIIITHIYVEMGETLFYPNKLIT